MAKKVPLETRRGNGNSFAAVTVITKGYQNIESKQVARPRMPMKRQKRKPKLCQRIVVNLSIIRGEEG